MKTVLVASSKGGVGKTTIATHLAAESALAGLSTVIIDADPQGSSTRWAERRAALESAVLPIEGASRHRSAWKSIPEGTDRCRPVARSRIVRRSREATETTTTPRKASGTAARSAAASGAPGGVGPRAAQAAATAAPASARRSAPAATARPTTSAAAPARMRMRPRSQSARGGASGCEVRIPSAPAAVPLPPARGRLQNRAGPARPAAAAAPARRTATAEHGTHAR